MTVKLVSSTRPFGGDRKVAPVAAAAATEGGMRPALRLVGSGAAIPRHRDPATASAGNRLGGRSIRVVRLDAGLRADGEAGEDTDTQAGGADPGP